MHQNGGLPIPHGVSGGTRGPVEGGEGGEGEYERVGSLAAVASGFDGGVSLQLGLASDASGGRVPQDLVLLELEADGEAGFEDPGGQLGRVDLAERGAEEYGAAFGQ